MNTKTEIIYRHDSENTEVIATFSGNMDLTIDQALDLCNVNMDDYAEEQGWDGYDWNSIDFRVVE